MKRLYFYLILFIVQGFGLNTFAQKTQLPNTLLWRISGHGLLHPSYLYGTMHLQDKRLFNFGDSVYKGLENVEGFAVEVDFKEYLDSMFLSGIKRAEDEYLAEQKIKLDHKSLSRSSEKIFNDLGLDKANLTKKDLKKIRDYRLNKILQKGEMPTIVDGYLFGLALRQKKWIGAVEDVADQLYLFDELGSELTPEKVLEPDAVMNKGMEQMIRLYLNQDLNGINVVTYGYNAELRDALLVKRNIKMARRIDSLLNVRTMFFAIGAAHLPGDSGVIDLLRNRGFTVDPVFSSNKIAANEYAKKLESIPWYPVQDENKMYTVEMPGNPSQFDQFGEAMKMKVFFDITSMTFYMTGQTIGQFKSKTDFDKSFEAMAERMGTNKGKINSKIIVKGNLQGREATFENNEAMYKVQLLQQNNNLFLVMAGSTKKDNLNTPDVSRFFNSFVVHNINTETKERINFSIPGKAFSVQLPGQPKKNILLDRQAEQTSWNFVSYDYVDNNKGLYYLIQVRDLKEGYFLTSDTVYFNNYISDTREKMDSVLKQETASFNGFPALYYDAKYNKNIVYKTLHIVRGNRVYILAVGGMSEALNLEADKLFNSIVLEEYPSVEWKTRQAEGFTVFAPSEIKKMPKDSAENSDREQFLSYDETQSVSYHIFKYPFSPYYWTKNDSVFFEERANAYRTDGDTVIRQTFSHVGNLKSLDLVIKNAGSHNIQKQKLFVNGDTLYIMLYFMPDIYIDKENHQKFFSDFKITHEIAPSIYTNKAASLLEALKSPDSAIRKKAIAAFNTASFDNGDLHLLHNALIQTYRDSVTSYTIENRLIEILYDLADSTTISFVANNYAGSNDVVKKQLIRVLANINTTAGYSKLKEILLSSLPKNVDLSFLKYSLTDSLLLAKKFYPEILHLSHDSSFASILVSLNNTLLDNSLISIDEIRPFEDHYLKHAKSHFALLKQGTDEWWEYTSWISFLGKLNDENANNLLQEYLQIPSINLKMDAALALIKNEHQVSPAHMQKIADDKQLRASLYYQLQQLDKEVFFPAAYAKQQALAESDIFQMASDDYEVASQSFIGERTIQYEGKAKKFYLFKITYNNEDDEPQSYLGIAGPYDLKTRELVPFSDACGIYWKEEFSKKDIESQFEAYISDLSDLEN